ncbi:hypothetical protein SDC9_192286 [bioreactor metagenome]|uniref:Uncharacterized protein n=1 Tax=bioreactor metagenome TaxID=1076179 RepID=A0A645I0A5_9ZZZZ
MLLSEVEIRLAEGFSLQPGIHVALKCQNGLARIVRREVRLPVMETRGIQIRQFVANSHQLANLRRRELARHMDKLLRVIQQFG